MLVREDEATDLILEVTIGVDHGGHWESTTVPIAVSVNKRDLGRLKEKVQIEFVFNYAQ